MKNAYKKTILDNGLKMIASPLQEMQSVALGIWIKVGGRHESFEVKGISHFLEHLLFKGSKKYSCRKLKESLEGVGGALNGFTSEELTCYLVKIPAKYLELALDILSDMVISPLLLQEDIDKEKTVILEEIKMYRDLPQSYVYELLDELLWPHQPLGASIVGTAESVSGINREKLYSYKQKYYAPQDIVVSVCGKLNYNKFMARVKRIFRACRNQNKNVFPPAEEKQERPQLKLLTKETEQTHLALGFHGFKRDDPLRHALALLHVILGGNMSSRLFNEVREKKGLAYEIGTQVKRFQDTGAFIVHAGIDNRKVTEAVRVILEELEKIKGGLVSPDEFRRAKEFYVGQLMLALEDTLDHMLWIGESTATLDKTYTLKDIVSEVSALKRDDVKRVAQDMFKEEKLNLALIGPPAENEKEISSQLHIR